VYCEYVALFNHKQRLEKNMDKKLIFGILAVACFAISAIRGLFNNPGPNFVMQIDWTAAGFCFSAVAVFLI
jgi:hypothetical protein